MLVSLTGAWAQAGIDANRQDRRFRSPAGSNTDILARIPCRKARADVGQTVIVENNAGDHRQPQRRQQPC